MRSTVAGPDDRWDRLLQGLPHDIYHTAGYHRFTQATEGGDAQLIVIGDADRGLAWPYLLRRLDSVEGLGSSDARDIGSLHGYTGPLTWGVAPGDPWLDQAWQDVRDTWRSQGAVSTFARFHPLIGNVRHGATFHDESEPRSVIRLGTTISIDCTLERDEAEGQYARVTRQEIARAKRAGLATRHDVDWRQLDTFIRLYGATMERAQAAPMYRVTIEDAVRMRTELAANLHLLVTEVDGTTVAAGLFSEVGGIVEALMVGIDHAYKGSSPLKVLLDDAREWAHERGDRVLHLGGGRGGRSDSLYAFKSRFSKRKHALHAGRWILDAARYRELTEARAQQLGVSGGSLGATDWFPAYRAPTPRLEMPLAIPVAAGPGQGQDRARVPVPMVALKAESHADPGTGVRGSAARARSLGSSARQGATELMAS